MEWVRQLRDLPVRYCCNYALLGGVGLAFEFLVLAIHRGALIPRDLQSLAVTAILIIITQTAAEYFRPDGKAGFASRFIVSAVHLQIFSLLILCQLDLDLPVRTTSGLLFLLYFALAFCEVRFRGEGLIFLLPILFFSIFLLLPALDSSQNAFLSGKVLMIVNVLLFLLLYGTWASYRKYRPAAEGGAL